MATLIGLDLLMMVFSVVLWKLGNDPLAAAAGTGAIALAADIGRRLLAVGSAEGAMPPAPLPAPPAPAGREPGGIERAA